MKPQRLPWRGPVSNTHSFGTLRTRSTVNRPLTHKPTITTRHASTADVQPSRKDPPAGEIHLHANHCCVNLCQPRQQGTVYASDPDRAASQELICQGLTQALTGPDWGHGGHVRRTGCFSTHLTFGWRVSRSGRILGESGTRTHGFYGEAGHGNVGCNDVPDGVGVVM